MKKEQEIKVVVKLTEGWEERFAKAAYDLYLRVEPKKFSSTSVIMDPTN